MQKNTIYVEFLDKSNGFANFISKDQKSFSGHQKPLENNTSGDKVYKPVQAVM